MLKTILRLAMSLMLYSGAQSVQILMTTEDGIFLTDIQRNLTATLLPDKNAQVHSLDYHYKKSYLYFVSNEHLKRMHFNITKDNEPTIISLRNITKDDLVKSVAVDWIRDRLYWTKSNHHGTKVMESNLSGKHPKHIISNEDLEHHHRLKSAKHFGDIVVDPDEGLLFVIAAKKNDFIGSIIRINLQEPFNLAIIEESHDARSIAIDAHKRRLFVVNGSGKTFYSCNYDGSNIQMRFGSSIANIFPLSVSENNLYYVTQQSFLRQLYNEYYPPIIEGKVVFSANMSHIYAIKVFDRRNQLTEFKYDQEQCRRKHCSYGCQVNSKQGVFCTCPVGLDLDTDGISCQDSERVVSTSPYDSITIQPKKLTNSQESVLGASNDPYNSSTKINDQNFIDGGNKSVSYRYIILISCSLLLIFSIILVFVIFTAYIKRNHIEKKCSVLLSQVNCDEERLIIEI